MLSIVAQNSDPDRQTEAELSGDFAVNALTILDSIPAPGSPAFWPGTGAQIDLDDLDPDPGVTTYGVGTSCSFPYTVEFDPTFGRAFVASSTGDRVIVLDATGARSGPQVLQLPDGSIPRDLLAHGPTNTFTVYCWGSNELRVYQLDTLQPIQFQGNDVVLQLGRTRHPTRSRAARELWYDGENSLNERTSCNTCHPAAARTSSAGRSPATRSTARTSR